MKSQMDQEAEVMKQSIARQESMSQMLEKEEEEEAQTSSPTFKRTVSANRPSEALDHVFLKYSGFWLYRLPWSPK